MEDLVVRKLLVDLREPFEVRWCGGDAFKSAFFNALSMSFPVGEQYFIDSLRRGAGTLGEEDRKAWDVELKGFIGQEATHRRAHAVFNERLASLGLVNSVEGRATRRLEKNAGRSASVHVAATAATEHFTAMFAGWLLKNPEVMAGAPSNLAALWMWHSAEELEHRSTAFDMYVQLGASKRKRDRVYRYITWIFIWDIGLQTISNLRKDGALLKRSTWSSARRFLFGDKGLVTECAAGWRRYLREDFHPSQAEGGVATNWLEANRGVWEPVRAER